MARRTDHDYHREVFPKELIKGKSGYIPVMTNVEVEAFIRTFPIQRRNTVRSMLEVLCGLGLLMIYVPPFKDPDNAES